MWKILPLLLPVLTTGQPLCSPDSLAMYQLVLETHWSEELFPKQYPQWRPPAQWSKTIGFTHNNNVSLFMTDSEVSEGVMMFVEKVDSDTLERETVNHTFLDHVFAPSIKEGVGRTTGLVFVDGNNTKLSCITALVPSPDWFIGLDSLDLCKDGKWVNHVRLGVSPMDAGTDNGLTFTSPNWATEPRGVVTVITNTDPSHPAASFHYPHLASLPSIATYSVHKLREYSRMKTGAGNNNKTTTDAERYRYHVKTSHANKEEIDFVPLNVTHIDKTNEKSKVKSNKEDIDFVSLNVTDIDNAKGKSKIKINKENIGFVALNVTYTDKTNEKSKIKSDKEKSRQTNLEIISQYLTLDPVVRENANAAIKDTKLSEDLELVSLVGNDGRNERQYAEILSNEIPKVQFYNSGKLNFALEKENSSLAFVPVRMVTKSKRLIRSRKHGDKKTAHDTDNSLRTKILVTNDGAQTRHKMHIRKHKKGFRSSSSLGRQQTSNMIQDLLNKEKSRKNILFGNLASLEKKELYKQILQSYNKGKGKKRLKKLKRRFRKRKHAKKKRPRNCRVSSWSSWGPCSVSCGIGESVRQRKVDRHPRNGGVACPALREFRWCGSARNCKKGYFDW